jgi:hypothetical protein
MRNVSKAALAFWLWVVLPLAVAGEPMEDPILRFLPKEVRKACEDAFPGHRALRAVERQAGGAPVYRVTVFSSTDTMVYAKKIGDDHVSELPLYHLELTADGKVVEESRHAVPESRVPKAVLAGYRTWNPGGVKGMAVVWGVELQKGTDRVFSVNVILSSVKTYFASFKEDGSVVAAEPSRVP